MNSKLSSVIAKYEDKLRLEVVYLDEQGDMTFYIAMAATANPKTYMQDLNVLFCLDFEENVTEQFVAGLVAGLQRLLPDIHYRIQFRTDTGYKDFASVC